MNVYLGSKKISQLLLLVWMLTCGLFVHGTVHGEVSSQKETPKSKPVQKKAERPKKTSSHQRVSTNQAVLNNHVDDVEPLSPVLLDIAAQVFTGRLQCELGQVVLLLPIEESPGRFQLTLKKQKYLMTPSVTPTGAVKLEDLKSGALWIQLASKSMLFNSKLGQRMADDCQGPGQHAVAMQEKISPPPSLFEPMSRVDH